MIGRTQATEQEDRQGFLVIQLSGLEETLAGQLIPLPIRTINDDEPGGLEGPQVAIDGASTDRAGLRQPPCVGKSPTLKDHHELQQSGQRQAQRGVRLSSSRALSSRLSCMSNAEDIIRLESGLRCVGASHR